jgi:hypothetical protein
MIRTNCPAGSAKDQFPIIKNRLQQNLHDWNHCSWIRTSLIGHHVHLHCHSCEKEEEKQGSILQTAI